MNFKELLLEENKDFVIKQLEEAEKENAWITFKEFKEHIEKKVEEDIKKYEIL